MFKINIITDKCLWLKTCPHFTLSFTENLKILKSYLFLLKLIYSKNLKILYMVTM